MDSFGFPASTHVYTPFSHLQGAVTEAIEKRLGQRPGPFTSMLGSERGVDDLKRDSQTLQRINDESRNDMRTVSCCFLLCYWCMSDWGCVCYCDSCL